MHSKSAQVCTNTAQYCQVCTCNSQFRIPQHLSPLRTFKYSQSNYHSHIFLASFEPTQHTVLRLLPKGTPTCWVVTLSLPQLRQLCNCVNLPPLCLWLATPFSCQLDTSALARQQLDTSALARQQLYCPHFYYLSSISVRVLCPVLATASPLYSNECLCISRDGLCYDQACTWARYIPTENI